MDIEKVRALQQAVPFKPYYLVVKDGRNLPVERPLFLGVSPNGKEIAYARSEGGFEFIRAGDIQDVVVDEQMDARGRRPQ